VPGVRRDCTCRVFTAKLATCWRITPSCWLVISATVFAIASMTSSASSVGCCRIFRQRGVDQFGRLECRYANGKGELAPLRVQMRRIMCWNSTMPSKLLANCNGLIVGWDPTPAIDAVRRRRRRLSQPSGQKAKEADSGIDQLRRGPSSLRVKHTCPQPSEDAYVPAATCLISGATRVPIITRIWWPKCRAKLAQCVAPATARSVGDLGFRFLDPPASLTNRLADLGRSQIGSVASPRR
jgi:hypothetical protein